MSRGLRNNNPTNIKKVSTPWRGQVGLDDKNHVIFEHPKWAVRAAIINLRSYWFNHGLRTIAAILSRWAPSNDTIGSIPGAPPNSPREYSAFVARRMGISSTARLSLFNSERKVADPDQLRKLVKAMSAYEIGGGYNLPDSLFHEGLALV